MDGFDYLVTHTALLSRFGGDPERMVREYGRASGGEKRLIAAAMSFLHPADRPQGADEVLLELFNIAGLDTQNTRILLRSIEIEAGHRGLVR